MLKQEVTIKLIAGLCLCMLSQAMFLNSNRKGSVEYSLVKMFSPFTSSDFEQFLVYFARQGFSKKLLRLTIHNESHICVMNLDAAFLLIHGNKPTKTFDDPGERCFYISPVH